LFHHGEGTPAAPRWRAVLCTSIVLSAIGSMTFAGRVAAQDAEPRVAAASEQPLADFTLRDYAGVTFTSAASSRQPILVVVFLGTECPLAKLYAPRIQRLADDYRARGVVVVAIDSNVQDSLADLKLFARDHQLNFPLLKDPGATVADLFDARRTPEAFVLDSERVVRYRGRIDDQYGVGTMRPSPTRHDLRAALDELLAETAVSLPRTDPIGCFIGRTKKPDSKSPVTFSNQIARIFNAHCVDCHRPGEIGPFSLTDYAKAAGWADTIAEATATDRMPPWHAAPHVGKFTGDRRLSAADKKLIADWVAAGAPEGERSQLPPTPKFLDAGWQLPRTPDVVVPMSAEPFALPAEGAVEYQHFIVDPKFKEDKWFTAAEVKPGNRAVVHHLMVFAVSKEFLRSGGFTSLEGYTVGYVPGMRVTSYPPGMAKRIPAGSQLVFQVHYTTVGTRQTDLSQLGLLLVDPNKIQYEVVTGSAIKPSIVIPPRIARYRATADSVRIAHGSYLLSMTPHMHLRGASFNYRCVFPSGKIETLLEVPRYDSNWQTTYRLAEPLPMPVNCRIRCDAVFDNSEDNPNNPDCNRTVRWGLQEWDEMMVGYFDVAIPRK
jgi:peroxiredoxin/mono/diheme cytochrome c family protein